VLCFLLKHFSFTPDGWTSLVNVGYMICTAHLIDSTTWNLDSMVLGVNEKDGTSRADDVVNYCKSQTTLFNLSSSNAVAIDIDTEATMITAGHLLASKSLRARGKTKWLGFINHLLQPVSKKAFSDLHQSEGALKACRNLITSLILHPKQQESFLETGRG
jgi:hypothetical protein